MENVNGFYFSLYKRNEQVDFFQKTGKHRARNDWSQGYEPLITHSHQSKDFNYNVSYNSIGLRGTLPPIEKDSNEYRIVVLGDSYIEGFGALEHQTFPMKLNQYLTQKITKKIRVINGGICGSNPFYEINLYKNKLQYYQPDLILMETNLTDTEDFNYASKKGLMPFSEYIKAISHIYRLIDNSFQITITDFRNSNTEKKTVQNMFIHISKFEQEIKNKNQQFILMYLAHRAEVASDEESALYAEIKKSNIPFIDLRKEYKKVLPNDFYKLDDFYWKNDGHHTPKGYDLMAKTVAEQLIQKKIIK